MIQTGTTKYKLFLFWYCLFSLYKYLLYIFKKFLFQIGVHKILVSLMAAKAEVLYDASKVLPDQIANAISELGFPASVLEGASNEGEVELEVKIFIRR